MSRIGKAPVAIPEGVTVTLADRVLQAKGKLGSQAVTLDDDVIVQVKDNVATVSPRSASRRARALWGTTRMLVHNAVHGVSEGFVKNLELSGVGYRAEVKGSNVVLSVGFSHAKSLPIPEGLTAKCAKPTSIAISGVDRQKIGQFAADIRAVRPPEPFKGKGIRYDGEYVRRKEGKKK
ncbi:MAG: 50S ribosomal protein L6 [Pseudomonadota bacterium]